MGAVSEGCYSGVKTRNKFVIICSEAGLLKYSTGKIRVPQGGIPDGGDLDFCGGRRERRGEGVGQGDRAVLSHYLGKGLESLGHQVTLAPVDQAAQGIFKAGLFCKAV